MWIKTQSGDLVNSDRAIRIYFDGSHTICDFRNSSEIIAEGDAIPAIINSLRRGDNDLGVHL